VSSEKPTFDPAKHLIRITRQGKVAEYLPVQKRVLWLRTEYPEAKVEIDLVHLSEKLAVAKATVELPTGARASDYGSETRDEFHDFIEKSCTKALGRALAQLGFGTQFAPELEVENEDGSPHVVDSPVERVRGRSYGRY